MIRIRMRNPTHYDTFSRLFSYGLSSHHQYQFRVEKGERDKGIRSTNIQK